jgi:hypothetical protein
MRRPAPTPVSAIPAPSKAPLPDPVAVDRPSAPSVEVVDTTAGEVGAGSADASVSEAARLASASLPATPLACCSSARRERLSMRARI